MTFGLKMAPLLSPVLEGLSPPAGSKTKTDLLAEGSFAELLAVLLSFNTSISIPSAPILQDGLPAGGETEVGTAGGLPWIGGEEAGSKLLLPLLGEQTAPAAIDGEKKQPLAFSLLPGGEKAPRAMPTVPGVAEGEGGSMGWKSEPCTPEPARVPLSLAEGDKEPAGAYALPAENKEGEIAEAPKPSMRAAAEGPPAATAAAEQSEKAGENPDMAPDGQGHSRVHESGRAGDTFLDQNVHITGKEEGKEPPLHFNRLSWSDEPKFFKNQSEMQHLGEKKQAPFREFPAVHVALRPGEKAYQSEAPTASVKEIPSVFQRLVQEARLVEAHGRQEITLQLEPEKLGRVHLTVLHRDGAVSARFEVENALARDALQAGLVELRQDLVAHGLRVEELQVLIGQNSTSGGAEMGGQDLNWSFDRPSSSREVVSRKSVEDQPAAASTLRAANSLDLRV